MLLDQYLHTSFEIIAFYRGRIVKSIRCHKECPKVLYVLNESHSQVTNVILFLIFYLCSVFLTT